MTAPTLSFSACNGLQLRDSFRETSSVFHRGLHRPLFSCGPRYLDLGVLIEETVSAVTQVRPDFVLPWAETEVEGCGAVGCVRVGLDGDGNGNGFAGGGGEDGADVDVVDADV